MVSNKEEHEESTSIDEFGGKLQTLLNLVTEAADKGDLENLKANFPEFLKMLFIACNSGISTKDFKTAREFLDKLTQFCLLFNKVFNNAGGNYLSNMEYQNASVCYESINEIFQLFLNESNALVDALKGNGEVESFRKYAKEIIDNALPVQLLSKGFYNMSLGHLSKLNRSPDIGAEYFSNAQDNFSKANKATGEGAWLVLSEYCGTLNMAMNGLEDLYRGNLNSSKSKFLKVRIELEKIIDKTIPANMPGESGKDFAASIKVDRDSMQSMYLLCDARYQFSRGDYTRSTEQYKQLCDISAATLESYSEDTEYASKYMNTADYHSYCGHKYLADGELHRENERWDNAFVAYEKAREEWDKAAEYYLKSRVPQAAALQETISNLSSSLESYIRQCKREKQLKAKIASIENENKELMQIIEKATGAPVQISSISEAKNSVDVNVELNVDIKNEVIVNIEKLLERLDDLPIEEDTKRRITDSGRDIVKSKEKGPSFLSKVKGFALDVCNVIKNVGEAARPVLPIVSMICGAAGVPMPIPI